LVNLWVDGAAIGLGTASRQRARLDSNSALAVQPDEKSSPVAIVHAEPEGEAV